MEIQKQENGYIIGENIFFGDDIKEDYLNLKKSVGEDMIFNKENNFKIEYPGEYDKNGVFFKVVEDSEGKLNYFLRDENKKVVIIQSFEILEKEEFDNIDFWIYTEENLEKKIEEMEFEGEKILLD